METKNLNTKYCVGLGEILFDVLPSGSQLGGAPANFAYHAGQHGLHSVAVSAVRMPWAIQPFVFSMRRS